jgi:hypothetical protein
MLIRDLLCQRGVRGALTVVGVAAVVLAAQFDISGVGASRSAFSTDRSP